MLLVGDAVIKLAGEIGISVPAAEITLAVVLFVVGLFLVIKGGDTFVDASVWVSDTSGISKVVIGATLVSVATTAPELITSLIATLKGYNDIAVGNAVGSPVANIGIGFALIALFTPGAIRDKLFGIKGFIMLTACALLFAFCLDNRVSAVEGIFLMLVFAASIFINIKFSKDDSPAERVPQKAKTIVLNILKFIIGAGALVLGSNMLVDNGQFLALELGIPPRIVGLTFVAIGTSLPEIVTSISAVLKKQNSLSLGNIIGANILDTTLILSLCSFVSTGGLAVEKSTITFDLPFMLLVMLAAVLPSALGKKLYRKQGALIAAIYVTYLVVITVR